MPVIDTRIPLLGQPPQIESPANALAKVLQLQGGMQQNALQAMQMQDMQAQRVDQRYQRQRQLAALENFPPPPPDAPPEILAAHRAFKAGLLPADKFLEFSMKVMEGTKPISVAPEHTLFDPRGKTPIYTAPAAAAKPAAPTELARLTQERDALPQGDPRRPLYEAAIAKATSHQPAPTSITKIENFEPANTQLQKGSAEALIKNFENLQNLPATLSALKQAKTLAANNQFIGSMGDTKLELAKFLNNNLGANISPEQVANAETLKSALFVNVMDNLKKMDAQPSEMQQKMMMDAMGRLTTDPKALPQIIDLWTSILESKAKEHNRRVTEAKKNGATFLYDISVNNQDAFKMPTAADIQAEAKRRAGGR